MAQIQLNEISVDELYALQKEIDSYIDSQNAVERFFCEGYAEYDELQEDCLLLVKTELYLHWKNSPSEPSSDAEYDSTQLSTREEETSESSHTSVEVVEELSPEEEADRQRLELKVERAFYEAGTGLRELRDRRLYRNTHKTWQEYCLDRFGFKRHAANLKIAASGVFENLVTKSHQILPTKETQVRPLTKLEPEEQYAVWQQAIEAAGGKVPTESLVKNAVLRHKGIVERLKEKHPSPPEFTIGDVVHIKALKQSPLHPFNGMWAVIEHVGSFSYTVRISIAKDTQQCKEEEVTKVEDEYKADIKVVGQRIAALIQFELEPVEYAIIEVLQRSNCFTPIQLQLLEWLEEKHLAF